MIWIADDPHTLGGDAAVEDRGCGSQVVGHGLQAVGLVTVREWSQGRGGEFQVEVVGCVFRAKDAEES
jgi:hypothetical protein